jgi:putative Ca2+/H+ antiporter (TMEM165/GDT1 family)
MTTNNFQTNVENEKLDTNTSNKNSNKTPSATENKAIVKKANQKGFGTVFGSTFITIFLAEMGDKTQLVTLLMSAESQSPWIVFAGSAIALISTSLLGVLIGYWLSKKLDPKTLDFSVAILLLFITGWLINDIMQ